MKQDQSLSRSLPLTHQMLMLMRVPHDPRLALPPADEAWNAAVRECLKLLDRAVPSETGARVSGYVAHVADHCDRIVWRNRYYNLPDGVKPCAAGEYKPKTNGIPTEEDPPSLR